MINGTLGTIDPTMMENGFYDVRLTVEDTSGQVTTADEVYQVERRGEDRQFHLELPGREHRRAGDCPITATRTYSSRTKDTSGDFGYGWSLSTTQCQVETSSVLGEGFIQTETQLPATQVNPLGRSLGGLGGLGGFGGLPGSGCRRAWEAEPARDPVQLPEHAERLRDDLSARWDAGEVHHGIHRRDLQLRRHRRWRRRASFSCRCRARARPGHWWR